MQEVGGSQLRMPQCYELTKRVKRKDDKEKFIIRR